MILSLDGGANGTSIEPFVGGWRGDCWCIAYCGIGFYVAGGQRGSQIRLENEGRQTHPVLTYSLDIPQKIRKDSMAIWRSFLTIWIVYNNFALPVIVPSGPTDSKCAETLKKINPTPLRPQGSPVQESYFKVIDAVAAQLKGKKTFISPKVWREKTAKSGLPGLDLPLDVGGKNLPPSEMVKIFEYAGRYSLNLRDVVGAAHARPLLKSKEPEHRQIIEKVARGEGYLAIAITEPEVGSDVSAMTSVSTKVPGGYLINGEKLYNARFETATDLLIFTQAPGSTEKDPKLNVFVLPKNHSGLTYKKLKAHGLYGNSFGGVSFKDVFVPEKSRLGEDGEGRKVFYEHFAYWRLMQTGAALGTARGALEQTAERMRSREAFGKKIGAFTHLQQELANLTIRLEMASAYVEKAAKLMDEGNYVEASRMAAGAKAEGVDVAEKAADFAMKTFGAEGYSKNVDLGERVNDLKGLRIADGTQSVLQSDFLKKTYGQDFWNMSFGLDH